jgi:hypothetical protein
MQMRLWQTNQKLLRLARKSAIPFQISILVVLMESRRRCVFGYQKRRAGEETAYEIAHA